MKRRALLFAALIGTSLAFPGRLAALELQDKVRVNGFLSQGYLISSNNNFLGDSKGGGTFQVNEVGLTFTLQATEKLRLGAQLLSRDLGAAGNNEFRLDWGLADYRFHDLLGVRIGKIKRPQGLYNEERDSDFLRPMAFLPQSIYDDTRRDMMIGVQGVGVYGNVPLGLLGDADYQLTTGEFNFPNDTVIARSIRETATGMANKNNMAPAPMKNPNIPAQITDLKMTNKYAHGVHLIVNTSIEGLKLGFSYLTGEQEVFVNGNSVHQGSLKVKGRYVYSLEYTIGDFVLASEYGETDRRQTLFGVTNMDAKSFEWYAMGSYAVTDKLTLSLLYDIYYNNQDDWHGKQLVAKNPSQKDYHAWRKDMGAGIRYDVNEYWTLKAEWHELDGAALYTHIYNPTGVRRYWSYGIVKASFNF